MTIELFDHAPTPESDSVRALVWLRTATLLTRPEFRHPRPNGRHRPQPPNCSTSAGTPLLALTVDSIVFADATGAETVDPNSLPSSPARPVLSRGINLAAPPPPPAPGNDPSAPASTCPAGTDVETSDSSESTDTASPYESRRHNNIGTDESLPRAGQRRPRPQSGTTRAYSVPSLTDRKTDGRNAKPQLNPQVANTSRRAVANRPKHFPANCHRRAIESGIVPTESGTLQSKQRCAVGSRNSVHIAVVWPASLRVVSRRFIWLCLIVRFISSGPGRRLRCSWLLPGQPGREVRLSLL